MDAHFARWRTGPGARRRQPPPDAYDRIVVAVRAEHEAKYQAVSLLKRIFGASAEVLVLTRDTNGPADTVAEMLRGGGVEGAFAIKDADLLRAGGAA